MKNIECKYNACLYRAVFKEIINFQRAVKRRIIDGGSDNYQSELTIAAA
jgi:hypothetical protein